MNERRQQVAFPAFGPARNGERGMTLIEVLVALGILAAVAVVFLVGMSVSSKAVMISQKAVAVDSLAKSQMENIKSWEYDYTNNPPDYNAAKLTEPTGYGINIAAQRLNANPTNDPDTDDGIQKITVTITHGGYTYTLVGYKVNRL